MIKWLIRIIWGTDYIHHEHNFELIGTAGTYAHKKIYMCKCGSQIESPHLNNKINNEALYE